MAKLMCPHCGWQYAVLYDINTRLVPDHKLDPLLLGDCPGSGQNPRNPDSDRRPLWRDLTPELEEKWKFQ